MRYEKLKYLKKSDVKKGMRVLMRVDANVDTSEMQPLRILRTVEDIRMIQEKGGHVVLLTHRGRPKGREATLSTKHLVKMMEFTIESPVMFLDEISKDACIRIWNKVQNAVILMENTRFEEGEEKDEGKLAKKWAELGDIYVNNAFGVSHRSHASLHKITKLLPSFAGSATKTEIENLNKPKEDPFILVLGGVKMETKIPLLKKMAPDSKSILLGSGFLQLEHRKEIHQIQKKFGEKIILPSDLRLERGGEIQVVATGDFLTHEEEFKEWRPIDIGPETEMHFAEEVLGAKSIFWNGPLGIVEMEDGENGTLSMLDALMHAKQASVIIGGGDTLEQINPEDCPSHIFLSTGGGATLTFMSGQTMPGLDPLKL